MSFLAILSFPSKHSQTECQNFLLQVRFVSYFTTATWKINKRKVIQKIEAIALLIIWVCCKVGVWWLGLENSQYALSRIYCTFLVGAMSENVNSRGLVNDVLEGNKGSIWDWLGLGSLMGQSIEESEFILFRSRELEQNWFCIFYIIFPTKYVGCTLSFSLVTPRLPLYLLSFMLLPSD